ncbi:hypothetical protein EJB05_00667, partial [Eragrostis curvula]
MSRRRHGGEPCRRSSRDEAPQGQDSGCFLRLLSRPLDAPEAPRPLPSSPASWQPNQQMSCLSANSLSHDGVPPRTLEQSRSDYL